MISSLHILGSRFSGGAERFYMRLVHALHARDHPTLAITRPGSMAAKELDRAIPQEQIVMRNMYDPVARWRIKRAVKKIQPDIVQTYMGRATRLTHLPARSRPVHVARLGNYYKVDGYRHADAWIGNTKGICDYLMQAGFPAQRVFHIYNFVQPATPASPEQLQALRKDLIIPEDALIILGAGRFTQAKGFEYLLKALSLLPDTLRGRPVYLVVLGDGVLGPRLKEYVQELDIQKRVRWPGWQTWPAPYYDLADLVAFTPRHIEPFGNVILEAWSHGKAVITTKSRGALEYSNHGKDLWQVPCENPQALAEGLKQLLSDDAHRVELGKAGLGNIQRRFDKDTIVDTYLDLYGRLLRG